MRATLVLLATLLTAPSARAASLSDGASSPSPDRKEILRTPIDIELKGASLKDVVEKIAILLRATPIVAPGVEGRTVDVRFTATPLSKVLDALMAASGTTIRLAGDRLYAYPAGNSERAPVTDEELDRRLLADRSLPRRPAGEAARRWANVLEFRADEPGAEAVTFRIDRHSVLALPGCFHTVAPLSGVEVVPLGGDLFDGARRLGFFEWDAPRPPEGLPDRVRIVSVPADGTPALPAVPLSGCRSPYLIRAGGDGPAQEPLGRLYSARQYMATIAILELGPDGERVLSKPRIQTSENGTASVLTGSPRLSASGVSLEAQTRVEFTPVASSGDEVWLAVVAAILRDVEPAAGAPPVRIRVASAAETLRVRLGETETVVLSSTYGQGESALILTVKVDEVKRPPRPTP